MVVSSCSTRTPLSVKRSSFVFQLFEFQNVKCLAPYSISWVYHSCIIIFCLNSPDIPTVYNFFSFSYNFYLFLDKQAGCKLIYFLDQAQHQSVQTEFITFGNTSIQINSVTLQISNHIYIKVTILINYSWEIKTSLNCLYFVETIGLTWLLNIVEAVWKPRNVCKPAEDVLVQRESSWVFKF